MAGRNEGAMSPRAKLAAFALVLAGSFGVGVALGSALPDLGPSAPAPQPHSGVHEDPQP